jgi:hypothetical protein
MQYRQLNRWKGRNNSSLIEHLGFNKREEAFSILSAQEKGILFGGFY